LLLQPTTRCKDDLIAADARAARRNLPPSGWARLGTLLGRALRRRCPECEAKSIFSNWLTIKPECPNCGYVFERESGYFLGAYAVNLTVAEIITVALLVGFLIKSRYSWVTLELIFIPMGILLPLLFFPYSRMLWMAIDLYFTPDNQI